MITDFARDGVIVPSEATDITEFQMDKSITALDQAGVVLLANMQKWRLRAIERVELSSALWSERHREIHVRSLRDIVREQAEQTRELRTELSNLGVFQRRNIDLLLPIAELPKVPLLDLVITVAGKRVYRVSKDESARVAAKYVISLAEKADLVTDREPRLLVDFLTFLFYHPSAPYEEVRRRYDQFLHLADRRYLLAETKKFNIDASRFFAAWERESDLISGVASHYVISDYASGAENPIIAIPYFLQELNQRRMDKILHKMPVLESPLNGDDVTGLLRYVREIVVRAHNNGEPSFQARKFLTTYFAYGYRWMPFVRCKVPSDRPFIIEVQDKRAIYFEPERRLNRTASLRNKNGKTVWQMVSFADAETNHVSIRVSDPGVRLESSGQDGPRVLDEKNERLEEEVDEEESTFELYLRQSSAKVRPERIYIACRLRLSRLTSSFLYLAMTVTAVGIALLIWRGVLDNHFLPKKGGPKKVYIHGITAKDAAVILIPVAFVASFLLVKESSTLVFRIRRLRQSILVAELFILLATAFSLYFWRLIWASP
ncbi:hypothetical protein [Streptomyces sp. SLBN-8D4]|uniref:hypothetical protein n=1 Tax=Streptomyces sp. SLBN-8D4 TaxID=3377728 RepID=UPI003C7CFAAB